MIIDDRLLDELTEKAKTSPRLRMNMDLRNGSADTSQRMLNALMPGTVVPIHRHRTTSETTVILRGRLYIVFYNDAGAQTERHLLDPRHGCHGVQIPAGRWHSVEVAEPSVIVESKDGAYAPTDPQDTMD